METLEHAATLAPGSAYVSRRGLDATRDTTLED